MINRTQSHTSGIFVLISLVTLPLKKPSKCFCILPHLRQKYWVTCELCKIGKGGHSYFHVMCSGEMDILCLFRLLSLFFFGTATVSMLRDCNHFCSHFEVIFQQCSCQPEQMDDTCLSLKFCSWAYRPYPWRDWNAFSKLKLVIKITV